MAIYASGNLSWSTQVDCKKLFWTFTMRNCFWVPWSVPLSIPTNICSLLNCVTTVKVAACSTWQTAATLIVIIHLLDQFYLVRSFLNSSSLCGPDSLKHGNILNTHASKQITVCQAAFITCSALITIFMQLLFYALNIFRFGQSD